MLLQKTPSFSGLRRLPRTLSRRLTLALLGVIAVFQLLTLRSENGWGDDWTLYVAHARNLAEGRPYSQTGFIYNPEESIVPKYPPGFPLLLAPVYSLTGMNFTALKVPGVVLFVAALGVLALLANAWDGRTAALLVVAIVGFNPFFTEFKNSILSDLPFLFFFLLALFVSDRALNPERSRSLDIPLAAAVGLAWWAAYATRTIGVVLPVAFSVLAIVEPAQRRVLAVSVGVFVLLAAAQALLIQGPSDYLVHFAFRPEQVSENVRLYFDDFRDLLDPESGRFAARIGFYSFALLATAGLIRLWQEQIRLPVLVFVLYAVAAFVWPFHEGLRMLIPLIPLGFFFALVGLRVMSDKVGRVKPALIAAAVLCVAGTYGEQYHTLAVQPSIPGVESRDARSLFAYIRGSTPKCAVVLFKKPRALALYTGRRAAIYSTHVLYAPWTSVTRLGATHLIVVRSSTQDSLFLDGLERQRPGAVTELFANPRFAVYDLGVTPARLRAAAVPSCNEARPQEQPRLVGSI